jgi:hypothetical protein
VTVRSSAAGQRLDVTLAPAVQRLTAEVARATRRGHVRSACAASGRLAVAIASVVVLLWLAGVVLPPWLPAAVLVLALGLVIAALRLVAPRRRVAAADAAAACDRAHGNHDRLAAAQQFAGEPAGDAASLHEQLVCAAIDDGLHSLQRVDASRVEPVPMPPAPRFGVVLAAIAALLLLPFVLPPHAAGPDDAERIGTAALPAPPMAAVPARAAGTTERTPPPPAGEASGTTPAPRAPAPAAGRPPGPPPPGAPVAAVPAASGQGQAGSDAVGDSTQTGAPRAAPTGNPGSGQSGGGQGSAASGAPEPSPSPEAKQPPPRPKPQAGRSPPPQPPGKPSESAGVPSGASRGSGRMAAIGNTRQDHNRGQQRDDDPEVEDEPIEDETDEQEQRGGVMPMRRGDQRPAARELSIAGDGPPDQGRGGPTPPKKARGTASLVLGQKLPDAVRGQPNPGTAKTTLEQIPPRPTSAPTGLALPVPAGRSTTPQSRRRPHGLGALVTDYHALLRAAEAAPAAVPPKDPR